MKFLLTLAKLKSNEIIVQVEPRLDLEPVWPDELLLPDDHLLNARRRCKLRSSLQEEEVRARYLLFFFYVMTCCF